MALYFKCPGCGREVFDFQGEHGIDFDSVIYECPHCGGKMTKDDIITREEFMKLDDEWATRELKEVFPITMLTGEQIAEAKKIAKESFSLEAVKYIHSIIPDEGLKGAKAYFDLYIDERNHDI